MERLDRGVDYLASEPPEFIAAFAQTNAGDMSPNLNHRPGSGPTEDEFENTRIIGARQAAVATDLTTGHGTEVTGGLDALATYVDLSNFEVRPEFTGDGRAHRTGPALAGAAALAGTDEVPAHFIRWSGRAGTASSMRWSPTPSTGWLRGCVTRTRPKGRWGRAAG